jgi:hypothetical protein
MRQLQRPTPPTLRAPRLRLHRLRGWLLLRGSRRADDDSDWGMECALPWLAAGTPRPR